jgi:hypothetical protein
MFIFISILSIDIMAPFYKNADFESVCEEYNQIIIRDGLLSSSQITELRNKLTEKDITITTLNLPTSTVWGDSFVFEVSASYSLRTLTTNFTKQTKTYNFRYKKSGVSLKGK